jgi:copper(I)-binding protein
MRYTHLIAAAGTTAFALLAGPGLSSTADAQSQTIQISNAWARRAAMAHGDMTTGSMDKGSMDKGAMGKGGMSQGSMDKGGMGKMDSNATGAVYVTIRNAGKEADSLLSASSDAAQTLELHETKNEAGVMKMRPVQKIAVPAGGKIEMKPGGYHMMLMGLKRDLKPGDKVHVTLKFERAGEVPVDAPVK